MREADKKQNNLLESILESNDKARPKSKADKEKKILMKVYMLFMRIDN